MYVPNSELTEFHARSPWVMLPRTFHELGYEVTLVCARFTGERPSGIRIVETSLVVRNPRTTGRVRSLVEPLFAFREIVRGSSDLVIVGPLRSSLFTFLPLVAMRRFVRALAGSPPTVVVLKADWSLDCTGLRAWEAALSKALLVGSTYGLQMVSLETSCAVERARTLPAIRSDKLVRVPLGFPQGTITRATYGGHPRAPVILCVARIARMKGQDVLLEAFHALATRFPAWSIHLVGPVDDPAFHDELRATANRYGLSERVRFLGFLDRTEVDAEFSRASIFCLPSVHSENAGQVQHEATALGLPVVTTDVSCGRDAAAMGWLVARAGDAADLGTKLEVLLRDDGERARVAARAQSDQKSYLDLAAPYVSAMPRVRSGG
jgi:glycosyltransferase involved in cell wall biosynthesis